MKFKIKYSLVLFFSLIILIYQNKLFAVVQNAKDSKITTTKTGNYAYDVWIKNDSINDRIQVTNSIDFGATWGTPINISSANQNAGSFSSSIDSLEKDLFVVWVRSNGINNIVQFSSSLNYGQNWTAPVDLSLPNQNASSPDIISDSIGEKIYTIWARSNGINDIIQFSKSLNSGQNFSIPINLSATLQNAKTPKITTDFTQNCICAVWVRSNGTNDIIQFKHSSDYGQNWNSTVDLSEVGANAKDPQVISTGSSIYTLWARQDNDYAGIYIAEFRKSTDNGNTFSEVIALSPYISSVNNSKIVCSNNAQYVYVAWYVSNGMYTDAHVVVSKDSGNLFTAAIVLNKFGQNCVNTDIATDINGQNTYVVWSRSNGTNDIVQIGKSNNYGSTWTTSGVDLSLPGEDAKNPSVTTNDSGNEIYVSWTRSDGTKDVIQAVVSSDYGNTFSVPQIVSN